MGQKLESRENKSMIYGIKMKYNVSNVILIIMK